MSTYQQCACGARKLDGKCPYGCEKFARHRMRELSANRLARKAAQEAVAPIGLPPTMMRDKFEAAGIDTGYAKNRKRAAARIRRRSK